MGPQQHQDVLSRNRRKEIYQGHCITRNNDKNTVFFDDVFLIHLTITSSNYRLYVINELALESTPTSNMTPQETITINNVSFLDNICNNNHFSCFYTTGECTTQENSIADVDKIISCRFFVCVCTDFVSVGSFTTSTHKYSDPD